MTIRVATYIHSLIEPAVDAWFPAQCRDLSAKMYAFYRPASGCQPGAFCIQPEKPGSDWLMVAPEPVRSDFTKPQVQRWIYGLSANLPLLPEGVDLSP